MQFFVKISPIFSEFRRISVILTGVMPRLLYFIASCIRYARSTLHFSHKFSDFDRSDAKIDIFPVASAIDVWVRDPPPVSSFPARGA